MRRSSIEYLVSDTGATLRIVRMPRYSIRSRAPGEQCEEWHHARRSAKRLPREAGALLAEIPESLEDRFRGCFATQSYDPSPEAL
jgi:hypothetical protein